MGYKDTHAGQCLPPRSLSGVCRDTSPPGLPVAVLFTVHPESGEIALAVERPYQKAMILQARILPRRSICSSPSRTRLADVSI